MGGHIETGTGDHAGFFRVYSSIVDDYTSEWVTADQLLLLLVCDRLKQIAFSVEQTIRLNRISIPGVDLQKHTTLDAEGVYVRMMHVSQDLLDTFQGKPEATHT